MNHTQAAIATVCEHRGLLAREILSDTRIQPIAWARQEAQYILREVSGKSLPEIGRDFDRDHTTVLHSLDAVARRMKDGAYRGQVEAIERDFLVKIGGFISARADRRATFKSTRKAID